MQLVLWALWKQTKKSLEIQCNEIEKSWEIVGNIYWTISSDEKSRDEFKGSKWCTGQNAWWFASLLS